MLIPRDSQQLAPRQPPAGAPSPSSDWVQIVLFGTIGAGVAAGALAIALAVFGGAYSRSALALEAPRDEAYADLSDLEHRLEKVERRLTSYAPKRETYVVVDTHQNRLRVHKGGQLLREAVCSTGSGVRLRDPRNGREWIFDTPSGEVKIWRKRQHPVWIKPDWAFIEEGYEPPRGMRDRIDDYSLGDYALDMPDGYIIHGTVFKTLLGRRVTHGCIRLGDDDLKFVYDTVPVGARVFLF
jgi:lipoprotein-anchoring transpeptidase ErfK/SrfK